MPAPPRPRSADVHPARPTASARHRGRSAARTGSGTGTTPNGPAGGGSSTGGGGFASNPKLRTAIQACGGGNVHPGTRTGAGLSHTAVDNFVTCVRKNGYAQMPKPELLGHGLDLPTERRVQHKVPGREPRVRKRASPVERAVGRSEHRGDCIRQ